MPTQTIWTALPTGRGRSTLTLSVHLAPRLTVPGGGVAPLADFPLRAWPPSDLTFDVVVGAATYPATVVSIVTTPDPARWRSLFGAVSVRSHVPPNRSQTPIHSYPMSKIVAFLKDRYAAVAIGSPEQHPTIADLLADGFDAIRFSGRDGRVKWNQARAQLAGALTDGKVVDTRAASTPTFDFVQLKDFHAPLDAADPAVRQAFDVPVEPPELEFHGAVQFVNQHPALMRLVGLVFDLEVVTTAAPPPAGPALVRVVPHAAALAGTTVRTPSTHALITADGFDAVPRPASTHIAPGWMRLEDAAQFEVVQVDADGGGLKAVDFAGNLKRRQLHPTEDTPDSAGLPTLRQDGFSVIRRGKAKETHQTLVDGVAKEAALTAGTLALYLDDIVRGVRVDVWDSLTARWHSVMWRTGEYQLDGGATVMPVTDEGFLGTTASKRPRSDDLYLSEEVLWWDGWSLVAPRPGRTLGVDPAAADPLIDRPPNAPGPDVDARLHFDVVPGSLPRLRYGAEYRFRARLVDLAGNSRSADDPDTGHATAAAVFGRFEPPQTPPVLLRHPNGPGESVETVVLRSNFDVPPVPATAERHLVPAKVGQLTAELDGRVDHPDPDPAAYAMLAALDEATMLNHPAIDPGGGDRNRYYDTASLVPTWAPDPAAGSVAFKLIDGPHAGHLGIHPLGDRTAWPAYGSIRLVLVEGTGTPSFASATRVLTVPMGKADVVHARLSARLDPNDLDQFALWHWVLEALPAGPAGARIRSGLIGLIGNGQHWMFEPFRVLTLVHAVRQPLARPEFPQALVASRAPEATFTEVTGKLAFDRKSTSRVDVLASWSEPVDGGPGTATPADVGQPGSLVVDRQTAFTLGIDHASGLHPTQIDLRERHELGDTRHRMITYRAVATTRFAEFFTTRASFAFGGVNSVFVLDTGNPPSGVVPGSVKLTYLDGGTSVPLVEGRDFTVAPVTGTVTFVSGPAAQLPASGTGLTAVYSVPPITRLTSDPPGGPGEFGPRLVSVPSSARPRAPKVRYVLPTFGWQQAPIVQGGEVVGVQSTRKGNGLRVYLDRPWWTSGEGEMLAVVLWPPAELADPPDLEQVGNPTLDADRRRPFVTQWGQDPIFGSRSLAARYPRLASFPGAVTATGLTLEELGSNGALTVNVAARPVGIDAGRDLWYCDLSVAPGPAYSPFIRLALGRWQPASIANAELSRVVLADFVQLAPDRTASVVFDDDDDQLLNVSLSGITHSKTEASGGTDPGSARVLIEQRRTDMTGELAWKQVGGAVPLTATLFQGVGHWIGQVHLPGPRTPDTWRLIIEQHEQLGAEPSSKPPLANPNLPTKPIKTLRLVHTDIVPI